MTDIKEYIMRMIVACLLCSIITTVTDKFKSTKNMIRSLCGVMLAVTLFSPILGLRWNNAMEYWDSVFNDADIIAAQGSTAARSEKNEGISSSLEAYILDKASSCNCQLQVKVTLSQEDPPIPISVVLNGNISPYYKTQLSDMIARDLGIPKEQQVWNTKSG